MIRYASALMVAAVTIALVGCGRHESPSARTVPAPSVGASSQVGTATTALPKVPSAAVSKPLINCSDATAKSGVCGAFNALKDTSRRLEDLGAFVSVMYYGHKKNDRRSPTQEFADQISNFNKTFQNATAKLPGIPDDNDLNKVNFTYQECVKRIVNSVPKNKDISDDITAKVADSCRFHVQRLINSYFRTVGIKIQKRNPDVFGLCWGQSTKLVRKLKGNPESNYINTFIYSTTISGLSTTAMLKFVDDKLSSVTYIFRAEHTNDNLFIDDFQSVDAALQNKYGKPEVNGVYWRDNVYKNDRASWGLAIAGGHMSMSSDWKTNDTEIAHRLLGDNFNITHAVNYKSREYQLAAESAERASANKKL